MKMVRLVQHLHNQMLLVTNVESKDIIHPVVDMIVMMKRLSIIEKLGKKGRKQQAMLLLGLASNFKLMIECVFNHL